MSVVHRQLSRKAKGKGHTATRPKRGAPTDKTPNAAADKETDRPRAPAEGDSLDKQLDAVEALLDAQEREHEQLSKLMDQLEDKLGAVQSMLTNGSGEQV
jgi:hypothetical protein